MTETEFQDHQPLAFRLRPNTLGEMVGQQHLIGPDRPLARMVETDRVHSMLLWGPPGSGKTTLAHVVARATGADFIFFSAVLSGVKEVRAAIERAQKRRDFDGGRTVLFVDEIHRFNKAQQDAFLPHVESGLLILIGATTENPSFEVNPALLSRMAVHILYPLTEVELIELMNRAISKDDADLGGIRVEDGVFEAIARVCNGDARRALTVIENSAAVVRRAAGDGDTTITLQTVSDVAGRKVEFYDKSGEEHFNLISALHKSLRGSEPDAALYWLYRMLAGGEDPMYLARRMVRFASEDVGLADPRALQVTLAAKEAYHFLGSPEGELALAEAAVYLACCPKSNAIYKAEQNVRRTIEENPSEPVPLVIRNAVTRLMRTAGYGRGYRYPHDTDDAVVAQSYLPDRIHGTKFYFPTNRGVEKTIRERLAEWEKIRTRLDAKSETQPDSE